MAEKILTGAVKLNLVNNYTTEINVLTSVVRGEIYKHNRIINATLIIKANSVKGKGFEIKAQSNSGAFEIIDNVSPATGNFVYINITEELNDIVKNNSETVTIQIKGNSSDSISFSSDTELKIKYTPERIVYEGNAYYDVSAGRAGSGKINLATGALSYSHADSTVSGISHIYNSWQSDKTATTIEDAVDANGNIITASFEHNCGKGWKLNLHQYLVKRKSIAGQDLYTYVDGSGNYHEFTEKYYYEVDKKKEYIEKASVSIGFDGKLTYGDKEIKIERKTTSGLNLITDGRGFKGSEKLELRHEEVARLEEEIEQLNDYKVEQNYNITAYEMQSTVFNLQKQIEQDSLDLESANQSLSKAIQDHNRGELRTKSRELEQNSYDLEKANLLNGGVIANGKQERTYKQNLVDAQEALNKIVNRHNVSGIYNYAQFNVADDTDWSINYTKYNSGIPVNTNNQYLNYIKAKATYDEKSNYNIPNNTKEYKFADGNLKYYGEIYNEAAKAKQEVYSYRAELYEKLMWEKQQYLNDLQDGLLTIKSRVIELNKTNFDKEEDNLSKIKDLILKSQKSIADLKKQSEFDKKEKDRIEYLLKKSKKDLSKAEKNLELKEHELKQVKLLVSENYMTTSDVSSILHFNYLGNLIAITDNYDNAVYITYEDNKITSVIDSYDKETKFEYKNGLLDKIIDAEEKVVCFHYFDGSLSRISYTDGTESFFMYTDTKLLESAANPAGYGIRFSYDNKQKITKVQEFTKTYEITNEGWRGLDNADGEVKEQSKPLVGIIYNTHLCTTLTNRNGDNTTHIFDILGKPVTVYEGIYDDPGDNTKSIAVDYSGIKKAFSITDNILYDNLLNKTPEADKLISAAPTAAAQRIYSVDIAKIPKDATDFVLSAWAKADSAFIASERKTDYSYSKIDEEHIANSDANKKNRKFELRAELKYDDGTQKIFSANFDWLNTGWQYLALPVTVDEDDNIGDRIVGKFPFVLGGEDRRLVSLTVIVDYSFNVNGRYDGMRFDCLTLRQGSWTYSELDTDGKMIYSEDGGSGSKTYFEYDGNGNIIKETLTNKQHREFINTYEYNKQNKLVRSTDFNGLVEETVYDNDGRAIKSITYNLSDPTSKLYSESIRDEKGKTVADIDITGEFNSSEYGFDHNGAVNVVKDAEGGKVAYGYHSDELVSVSSSADGAENVNTFKHTLGFTTKVSSGGTDYTYTYDGWGRQKEVKIAGENYLNADYVDDKTTVIKFANGESFTDYADGNSDETVKITLSDNSSYDCKTVKTYYTPTGGSSVEQSVDYCDKEFGLLRKSIDKSGKTPYNTEYYYDKDARLISKIEDGAGTLEQEIEYDGKGAVKYSRLEINGVAQTYFYEYDNAVSDRQLQVTLPGGTEQNLEYDGLGRVSAVTTQVKADENKNSRFTKEIYYAKYGDHATKYVNSVWFGVNDKDNENFRYAYDKKGNITSVKENGKEIARYAYDSLNRLIREDNTALGKTEIYEYDNNGNIISKTAYRYTYKDELRDGKRSEYGYRQNGWRDQLLSFDGGEIGEYDAIGNPWKYRGKDLKWEKGRNLVRYGGEIYDYNAAGIRTSKISGDIESTYYLDGTKIVAEERRKLRGNSTGEPLDVIYYHYGVDGIAGFEYRKTGEEKGTTYIYRKNVQGDITHIYTKEGQLVVKYSYDAWGNHNVYAEAGYESLATLNPFRYRGYCYDVTTGLYYLNSRYYDPQTGRFINADAVAELDPETINGLNLYSYCGNNPVMRFDPSGHAWWHWLVGIAVIAVLAVAVVLTAGIAGVGIGAAFSAGFAGGAIGVGASGLAVTIAAGAFAGAVVGAGIGLVTGAVIGGITTAIGGGNVWQGMLDGAASGFMMGAITGAVTGGLRGAIAFKNSTPLFRAVNSSEANGISKTGKFSLKNGAYEGKQFGLKLSETKAYANLEFNKGMYNSIVATRVPNSVLSQFTKTATDAFVFKSGVITVASSQMGLLNSAIKFIMFFPL